MALSGTYTYSVDRGDIIQEAFEILGSVSPEVAPSTNEANSATRTLQLLIKAEQAKGLFLHTYKDAILFLETGKVQYKLGPASTDDHCAEADDVVSTAVATDASTSATVIAVDSATGLATSDKIGIELDDGESHWSTISGISSTNITIAAGIPSAAADGNKVYAYTSRIQRPLLIRDVNLRNSDDVDRPISLVSLSKYRNLSTKQADGDSAVEVAYDPQITAGLLNVWPRTDNVVNRIVFTYKRPIQDITSDGHNPELPQDWYEWLCWQLAYKLSFKRGLQLQLRMLIRDEADRLKDGLHDFEDRSVFIQPERN